ncbi:nucleotidyltransferase substrate binding protein [Flavobacterium antarcticum]|uniref:nucleotidyltransferase substrate binding protein n=1 Tax=Flavobacterium antarcticum TaxID=271155 RepID=UPI0003B72E10|nr:nucleotidyltransferase substrate binding protein [Flavobacterium antarcticum]
MNADVRWKQRFENFQKAFQKLVEAVAYIKNNDSKTEIVLDEIIKEGLIQRFEYTHELAWNVMKDYATYQGNTTVGGSRDATREAFQLQLMSDGAVWMDMIGSRNKTSHTYNEATADEIYLKILNDYFPAFLEFKKNMEQKMSID